MRVYIAGPMTGLPEFNHPAFHAAAEFYRQLGYEVFNPAELIVDTSLSWEECMRRDLPELCTCDGIVLLEGWRRSRGARLELNVAKNLGLQVFVHASAEQAV